MSDIRYSKLPPDAHHELVRRWLADDHREGAIPARDALTVMRDALRPLTLFLRAMDPRAIDPKDLERVEAGADPREHAQGNRGTWSVEAGSGLIDTRPIARRAVEQLWGLCEMCDTGSVEEVATQALHAATAVHWALAGLSNATEPVSGPFGIQAAVGALRGVVLDMYQVAVEGLDELPEPAVAVEPGR